MIRNIFTHQLTATTAKISNSPQSPPKTRGKASILNLRLFHVGLTGRVMDTLKIAPPRRRKLDPRERNPVRCLLYPPLPSSTLHPPPSRQLILRWRFHQPSHPAIFHGLFTFRRREKAHANGHVPCSFTTFTKKTRASIRGK